MPNLESRHQSFNGQSSNGPRQQHHPEDSTNIGGFLSLSPPSSHFMPQDAQGGFAFSAEPSMMDYGAINGLAASSTPGDSSIFTPNTGSSYDSLHPDIVNQVYSQQSNAYLSQPQPQPQQQLQQQSHNFPTNTHPRTGQSVSPSHSLNEYLSPEGYISDTISQDYSQYATPSFGDPLLEGQQIDLLNINDHNALNNSFDPGMLTANNIAMVSYSTPGSLHSVAGSQLLSPCPTNNSSPVIGDDASRIPPPSRMQYGSNEYRFQSPPSSAAASNGARCTPKKQQQHSPALTNSPNGVALANPQPRAPHLTSPIVRVENYSGRESPVQSDISRPMSKRSHGSRRSANHLSPFPVDHSSDEDDTQPEQVRVSPVNIPTRRNDDGSWVPDGGTGQVGLSPDDRTALNNAWTPSIEEIAEQRLAAEKKAEVREWLSKSEMGSEVGDDPSSAGLLKPVNFKPNRPRARSHNDATRQGLGHNLGLGVHTAFDDSRIPGPGVYIEEPSEFGEYDYDDDEEEEGEGEDEDVRPESPPAEVDVTVSHQENSYFAVMLENGEVDGTIVHPWNDAPFEPSPSSTRYQPPTSNAAMMRYRERAKDVESASLAATLGSRRMSESDLGSIRAAPGVIKAIRSDSKKSKESRQRRLSFLDTLILKRTNSNLLKRKGSMPVQQSDSGQDKPKETLFEKPKRMGSWGRPKSPRLDTSVANQGKDIGLSSSTNLSATSGPWAQAKNAIRRSRSRSDLGKSPGLKELMTHHGGPPMPLLASPLGDTDATKPSPMPSAGEDDDEDGVQDHITMDLKVRSDPIIPTYEGFKTHARQLNPRLVDYMVDRITQEQMRRYKRLLEFKVKHLNAVENRNCASTKFCLALGGESKQLPPRAGNKDSEAPFIGFQITAPGSPQDDGEPPAEGTVVSAQFPSGVPLPPVKRLPAEFECPLCFKVKKFYKPSDWTKHVHEDVQPFTCTFPNCGEPKSFKRKADWVRHENERHRQLENWTCCIADCMHTCYRKDNFVQHLVREHKITEPRARTGRGGNNGARDASTNGDASWSGKKDASDDIWALVERCRRDTMKQPKNEPCRFCGNICNSWKKLTVHLAKHMEQISMPILPLVEQKQINAETVISPVVEIPEHSRLSTSPGKPVLDNPSRYNPPNSTFAPGLGSSFLQYPMDTSPSRLTASVTHTYPPPQLLAYRTQQQAQANYMPTPVQTTQNFLGQSYPGLHRPPKPRGAYVNELLIPNQQQPYLNGNIQSGPNQYPMTPISALGQEQQQPIFSTSPVETSFPADTLGSTYYTQEPQATSGAVTDMGYDTGSTMQNQLSAYQEMAALVAQERQRNHQYYSQ